MNKNCGDPFDTARFTVRYGYYPVAGTVSDGTGTVWQKPTRGIPVVNPTPALVHVWAC